MRQGCQSHPSNLCCCLEPAVTCKCAAFVQYVNVEANRYEHCGAFHTACWDHTMDPTGKRVAVVGTGAKG
jgi:hypothetical protein